MSPHHSALRRVSATVMAAALMCVTGCASAEDLPSSADSITDVVATTPILTDIAAHVAGERARVTGLLPPSADPHTHELTLRDVRNVANADIAFTNGLLLEPQSVLRSVTNSARKDVPVIPLAEKAEDKGATLIPLVENLSLDSVWLGLRASGVPSEAAARDPFLQASFTVTDVEGPGHAAAYVTGTFGQPDVFFDSGDGVDSDPLGPDSIQLPPNAHTHMSWSFSQPGIYRIAMSTAMVSGEAQIIRPVANTVLTFAVGVPAKKDTPHVLKQGHHDVRVDVGKKEMDLNGDGGAVPPEHTVIEVPTRTLQQVPSQRAFRFLGEPGSETYLLPQAVLGKHVHGDLDPHLWHSVDNTKAMVEIVRDELAAVDPHGAADYQRNAQAYLGELDRTSAFVREQVGAIPEDRRHLVTAHDGYAYLAKSYGIDVAGFITPNPNVEPSARDIITLTRTLENLKVPAVFVEPTLAGQARDLTSIAERLGIAVCTIHGDTFDERVASYVELMRSNATTLRRCLSGEEESA